jgi:ABC transport system ATP-binding/permease protein
MPFLYYFIQSSFKMSIPPIVIRPLNAPKTTAPQTVKKTIHIRPIGNQQGNARQYSTVFDFLEANKRVTIGRHPHNDITLTALTISNFHVRIEMVGNLYKLTNLSPNASYVNGKRIKTDCFIAETDKIQVGSYAFTIKEAIVDKRQDRTAIAIEVNNISKKYGKNKEGADIIGLHPVSFKIPSKQFVALMGPSGCGKSTLLKCMNRDNPASSGSIKIQGLDLEDNFNTLRRDIGYVPQDDIVHRDLSINDTLYYAAKLRLADDVTEAEMQERINAVLESLNLNDDELRTKMVGKLSGGQRKRVSIAVELLSEPSILFLDEPTSPLDPESIDEFLTCIQTLTQKNDTTVVMVTHKPDDLAFVDAVIMLTTGGYAAYYGSKDEVLPYFKKDNITSIYSILSDKKNAKKWYTQWREKSKVVDSNTPMLSAQNAKNTQDSIVPESFFRQLRWLSQRYFHVKINNPINILWLLLQPVIVAVLMSLIFNHLTIGVLFLTTISSVWFGVNNAAKEIVEEQLIYRRERMINLRMTAYLLSKIAVLSLFALLQVFLFITILSFTYSKDIIPLQNYWASIGFMFFLTFSAILLGLLLSAIADNAEQVMTVVPIILIPQILLSGVITDLSENKWKEATSYATLGRWGTEGFCRIQDHYAVLKHRAADADISSDSIASVAVVVPVIVDTTITITKSIKIKKGPVSLDTTIRATQTMDKPHKDSTHFVQMRALGKALKLYSKTSLKYFDSARKNFYALLIIDLFCIFALIFTLKYKDPI